MIKLEFSNFKVIIDGLITKGKITATIKFLTNRRIWETVAFKNFSTKITLHPEDKADLNKAYKYIRAKLEKNAYKWALKNAEKQLLVVQKDLKAFVDFVEKATHIVDHDTEYLNKF